MIDKSYRDNERLEVEDFSNDYPTTYDKIHKREVEIVESEMDIEPELVAADELPDDKYFEPIKQEGDKKVEKLTDDEINIKPTPRYTSFEEIKKELVVLDLERQIAWEEVVSLKYEFKQELREELSPSNFVKPALGLVGAISGFVLLKNLIFGD